MKILRALFASVFLCFFLFCVSNLFLFETDTRVRREQCNHIMRLKSRYFGLAGFTRALPSVARTCWKRSTRS